MPFHHALLFAWLLFTSLVHVDSYVAPETFGFSDEQHMPADSFNERIPRVDASALQQCPFCYGGNQWVVTIPNGDTHIWGYSILVEYLQKPGTDYIEQLIYINGNRVLVLCDIHDLILPVGVDVLSFALVESDYSLPVQVQFFCFTFNLIKESCNLIEEQVSAAYVSDMRIRGKTDVLNVLKPKASITVHTFGDSQAASLNRQFFHKITAATGVDIDIDTHWLGPRLMHTLVRDKELLLDMRTYPIKPLDIVMFVFGYIDVSHHLHKYFSKFGIAGLHSLVDDYFETIHSSVQHLPSSISVWVHGIIPPTNVRHEQHQHLLSVWDATICTPEALQLKVLFSIAINHRMQMLCKRYNYKYIDMYDEYADEHGYIKHEHNFYFGHVWNYTEKTQTMAAKAVLEHMQKNV